MATSQDSGQYGGKPYLLDSAKSLFSTLIRESASGLCSLSKTTFLKSNFLNIVLFFRNSKIFASLYMRGGILRSNTPFFFLAKLISHSKGTFLQSISTLHFVDQVRHCYLPVQLAPIQILLDYQISLNIIRYY